MKLFALALLWLHVTQAYCYVPFPMYHSLRGEYQISDFPAQIVCELIILIV